MLSTWGKERHPGDAGEQEMGEDEGRARDCQGGAVACWARRCDLIRPWHSLFMMVVEITVMNAALNQNPLIGLVASLCTAALLWTWEAKL